MRGAVVAAPLSHKISERESDLTQIKRVEALAF